VILFPSSCKRRRTDWGAVLGLSLMLLILLCAAGAMAVWLLRGETHTAMQHRLTRQLLDCAESGLTLGKQFFSTTARDRWNSYLSAGDCTSLPCPPFPLQPPGPPVAGYPDGEFFRSTVTMGSIPFERQVAIYNNQEVPPSPFADQDGRIFVYARCRDPASGQERAVQALIQVPLMRTDDYTGQAGRGFRNQGNVNF
jgi:hypothetical protein